MTEKIALTPDEIRNAIAKSSLLFTSIEQRCEQCQVMLATHVYVFSGFVYYVCESGVCQDKTVDEIVRLSQAEESEAWEDEEDDSDWQECLFCHTLQPVDGEGHACSEFSDAAEPEHPLHELREDVLNGLHTGFLHPGF